MKSPAGMKIIQIEITNSCVHKCSNCTRFCGHHRKPFFMDFDTFKNAVDSLKDFKGIVGIMGGEPTLHPQFSEFIRYFRENRPDHTPFFKYKMPIRNFNDFHSRNLIQVEKRKRGLWSALGMKYYENFELIQDTFAYQCINDHRNAGLHQALLITRKELGIPDEEWIPLRDNCWIQNEWSASITPKGAFFCEIAAALDMLFDGPGGWPIEPGWWKRTPADFKDQLHWCELCSAALPVPSNPGNEEMDIISPVLLEKLKAQGGSYKLAHDRYYRFDPSAYDRKKYSVNHSPEPYLSGEDKRVSQDTSSSLFPQEISIFGSGSADTISREDAENLRFRDWLLIVNMPSIPLKKLTEDIKTLIFNPGVCYYAPGKVFILIHRKASSLSGKPAIDLKEIISLYSKDKRCCWKNWKNPDDRPLSWRFAELFARLRRIISRNLP